jgi:predicted MFS family arabinose efflux permease
MNAVTFDPPTTHRSSWSAVGSMALCVAMLIAAEFMPVSLLTPIAADLDATQGLAGQAISISGLFAVLTSLLISSVSSRFDRRHVLISLTGLMLASLVMIAEAFNFTMLMTARALLGVAIGGFWSLATATIMRLVPEDLVPKALAIVYTGNAVAMAFAAPMGSFFGGVIGWRGVFWALTPLVVVNLIWQWSSLPSLPSRTPAPVSDVFRLLKRPPVAIGMIGVALTFSGAFATFTYLRPFLESVTQVNVTQLSLLLLGLGAAGFVGTYAAGRLLTRRLRSLLWMLPVALAVVTVGLLLAGRSVVGVAFLLIAWGAINSAIPVAWSAWLAKAISDEPESGGGLMVAVIQLSIMLGAAFGGWLLDHWSISATFIGGVMFLAGAAVIVSKGELLVSVIRTVEPCSLAHRASVS